MRETRSADSPTWTRCWRHSGDTRETVVPRTRTKFPSIRRLSYVRRSADSASTDIGRDSGANVRTTRPANRRNSGIGAQVVDGWRPRTAFEIFPRTDEARECACARNGGNLQFRRGPRVSDSPRRCSLQRSRFLLPTGKIYIRLFIRSPLVARVFVYK